MRLRPGLTAGALVVALAAGCGVPSDSSVVVEGRGQAAAPALADDGTSEPNGRTATTEAGTFLDNYLAAAAGNTKEAVRRAREFFAPDERGRWSPALDVQVVRPRGNPIIDRTAQGYEVRLTVTVLGSLGDDGIFQPLSAARTATYDFTIANNVAGQSGLFLTGAPPAVLLSDEALERYFELRTIYFWSRDHRVLVPDLRYLPRRDYPVAQRPTLIIEWLLRGPSPWLKPVVEPLPQDAQAVGRVPAAVNNVLKVVLTKAIDTDDAAAVERLATQLRWSLRDANSDPTLELKIDQTQRVFTGGNYLTANPAFHARRAPVRFCVFRGEVRQLRTASADAPPIPSVPAKWNQQVERAALASVAGRMAIALVRTGPGGQVVLDVGGGNDSVPDLTRTDLRARTVSQPVWLPRDPDTGLIVADKALVSFRSAGGSVRRVQNSPTGITAFAVAPDGYRLAYIADGRLFVAPLTRISGDVTVGEPRAVPTTLSQLTAVGWSQQDWLLIAGRQTADGLVALRDITVDGAVQADPPRGGQYGTQAVVHLVASTDDPVNGRGAGEAMYVANDLAYEVFSQSGLLTAADVGGPSPSVAPGAGAANPTYPFFLD